MSEFNNNQNNNNQNNYQPQPHDYNPYPVQPEMGVKDWVITLLILAIPCVNIVMMIIWAFSETNKTRSNFCKANLIVIAVIIVISIVFSTLFSAAIYSALLGLY